MNNVTPTLSWPPMRRPAVSPPSSHRLTPIQWFDPLLKLLVPALMLAALVLSFTFGSFSDLKDLLSRQSYTSFLPTLAAVYTLLMLSLQIVRTVLWACYKPFPLADDPWPSLTVIIPAYNEGAMVEKAIESVAASDYPADLLEIICIDDGSQDDTWSHIQRAQRRYPNIVRSIRFPTNRGKKEGLYAGFTRGRSEIFVTIDSDCVIAPDALRHLIAPLMHETKIGAVAGNVKVFNRHQSFMGKMQGVRFVNLDYLRASQSLYRAVICTPGSLSAYRRTALAPHLNTWRRQTFLGAPCRHSEDRALTNFILRGGHYTYYQRTALVYTLVPETFTGVCKMYLRWERGNVRESCVQLGYLFTRYRDRYRILPIIEFFLAQLEYPLTLLFFGLLLGSVILHPLILIKLLTAVGVISMVNLIYYLWLERDLEFIYGVIYSYYAFFLLQWIYPYAFVTVRNRHWLTR